ncbi:Uncharacterised protein [Serratia plymuthica]|uniref:Uncharacterized protein n=1 Tax=Serratia plymuthica TaxID=82996 RepID=A0A2X4V3B5_SERPL|nr:Uncharacterised protein [Serratia plymuthica]
MFIPFNSNKRWDLESGGFQLRQNTGVNVINRHHHRGHIGIVRLFNADNLAQRFNRGDQAGACRYFQFFHNANSQTVKDEVVPRGTAMR